MTDPRQLTADPLSVLARVPSLAGTPRQVTALPGGLTNQNFKVTTPAGVFVARLFSEGAELLAIDRDREYRNSVIWPRPAQSARRSSGARPQDRVLVLGFLDGRTLTNADVARPATLTRDRCRLRAAAPGRPVRR